MLESWQVYCLVFTGWIIHDLFLGNAIFRAQQNPPSKRGVLDGDGIMTWFKSLARSDEMRALSLLSSDILRVSYNSQRGAQTFWNHTWCRQHSISFEWQTSRGHNRWHLVDKRGDISWTLLVTFCGHFCPGEVLFLGDFSWTFFGWILVAIYQAIT